MWILTGLIVGFWVLCGIAVYGKELAYFQRQYPDIACLPGFKTSDKRFALAMSTLGPFAIMAIISNGNWKHGFMWK